MHTQIKIYEEAEFFGFYLNPGKRLICGIYLKLNFLVHLILIIVYLKDFQCPQNSMFMK